MYVCMCNPFTDKDVHAHLSQVGEKTCIKDVYRACSGGENMNCGSCACELKTMVETHNHGITINELSDQMQKITVRTKETA